MHEGVIALVRDNPRKALDMEPQIGKFFSDAQRRSYDLGKAEGKAEGEAKGKAEGKAEALLMFLRRRGLAVTEAQRQQIVTCIDLAALDRWLECAFSITSVDELLG
jgi:flagellar biosynthesis/type III secretory pathway protein FliH